MAFYSSMPGFPTAEPPNQAPQDRNLAIERLRALLREYGPMLTPGYSGETGFGSGDAHAYSRLQ